MKSAKLLKENLSGFLGRASLYECDPPMDGNKYVVVSALGSAFDTGRPETYIFPSTPEGKVTSWGELHGSYRGGTDHSTALAGAGYEIVGR